MPGGRPPSPARCSSISSRPASAGCTAEAGGHPEDPPEGAGGLHPGHVAAARQPDDRSTACAGRREIEPDPITPADQVFFAPFIGKTVTTGQRVPLRRQDPVGLQHVAAAVRHRLGPQRRRQDGRSAATPASSTRASPASTLASSPLDQRQPRPVASSADSALTPILGPLPAYPDLIPQSQIGDAVRSRRLRLRQGLPEPAHHLGERSPRSARSRTGLARAGQVQLRQGRPHHPLRQPQRPAARLALGHRPGARRRQRHRHPDHRRVDARAASTGA